MSIERGIDVRGQMLGKIVDAVGHEVIGESVEHIANGARGGVSPTVESHERIDEGIAHLSYPVGGGAFLSLKEQEGLVLDAQVSKGKFHASILIARGGHELVEVFFQMNLRREVAEDQEEGHH